MDSNVELFYHKNRNSYTVQFANNSQLSKTKITDIFSQYGIPINVAFVKDKSGLWFVTYRHLNEAVECILGLRKHQFIKLLPQQSQSQKDKCNSSKTQNNKNIEKRCQIEAWINEQKILTDNSLTTSCTSKKSKEKSFDDSKSYQTSSVISKDRNLNNEFLEVNEESRPLVELKHKNKMPRLIHKDTSMDDGSIVTYVKCDSISHSELEYKSICAQHIIVANVHEDISVHYILHLFEKYDPIAISLMNITPKSLIRYCHVYLKTQEQAIQAEKTFDKYILYGKNLIVLRSHKFEREANDI